MSSSTKDFWKLDSSKRRDSRNIKTPDEIPRHITRKNKKWCRGKTGIAHKPKCTDYKIGKLLICERCGKHLERWLGSSSWYGSKQPDWVK